MGHIVPVAVRGGSSATGASLASGERPSVLPVALGDARFALVGVTKECALSLLKGIWCFTQQLPGVQDVLGVCTDHVAYQGGCCNIALDVGDEHGLLELIGTISFGEEKTIGRSRVGLVLREALHVVQVPAWSKQRGRMSVAEVG